MNILETVILGVCIASFATALNGQTDISQPSRDNVPLYSLYLRNASLDVALDRLRDLTGKSITIDSGITASVTLSTPEKCAYPQS